jgi:hypothetical protein
MANAVPSRHQWRLSQQGLHALRQQSADWHTSVASEGGALMTTTAALIYLREQHKAIADACVRGRIAQQHGENVMPYELVAMEISEASKRRDNARLVELAEQWKAGAS